MDIKELLKNRRIDLGLTLKDVAEAVGVSEATVSRWESGDIANMKRDRIEALSMVLQISPMAILGRPEPETRLLKYAELFERLQQLPEPEQQKAAKMVDSILTTFEE